MDHLELLCKYNRKAWIAFKKVLPHCTGYQTVVLSKHSSVKTCLPYPPLATVQFSQLFGLAEAWYNSVLLLCRDACWPGGLLLKWLNIWATRRPVTCKWMHVNAKHQHAAVPVCNFIATTSVSPLGGLLRWHCGNLLQTVRHTAC